MYWGPLLKRLERCWLQALGGGSELKLLCSLSCTSAALGALGHVVALPLKGHSFTVLGPTESRIHFPDRKSSGWSWCSWLVICSSWDKSLSPKGWNTLTLLVSSRLGHRDTCGSMWEGWFPRERWVVSHPNGGDNQNNTCPLGLINIVFTCFNLLI